MSTQVEVLQLPIADRGHEAAEQLQVAAESAVPWPRVHDPFTEEQIGALVHRVFFPASGKSRKQIVFSAVDEEVDVGGICALVAESLAARTEETVAIVDAHARSRDRVPGERMDHVREAILNAHTGCEQRTGNLWSVPGQTFWGDSPHAGSPAWVVERLGGLRTEFHYSLIHAPAAGVYSGTCLLGQVSDGLVLVIEADYTRRSAAQKAKEMLYAANVRILGTVLSGRTFPIPESIYRRL